MTLKLRILSVGAVSSALTVGAIFGARLAPNLAQASYQVTATDPQVTFDPGKLEAAVATFCKTNGITTNAQYAAGVAGITAGSALELAAVKAVLNSVTLSP